MDLKNIFKFPVLSLLLVVQLTACNSLQREEQRVIPSEKEDTILTDYPDYTGRLYTSGLSQAEAEKLELPWPVYQLTGEDSYFISGQDSLSGYIGHCISLKGATEVWEPGTETVNDQYTYGRGKLTFKQTAVMDAKSCGHTQPSADNQVENIRELRNFIGSIRRMNRPAPDIAYDYRLKLSKPFRDETHPVEPGKLVEEIPVYLMRPQDAEKMEEFLQSGKQAKIKGFMVQGYAESKVLQVAEAE